MRDSRQAQRTTRPRQTGRRDDFPTTKNQILAQMRKQRRSEIIGCLAAALTMLVLCYLGIVVIGWFYGF